MNRIERLIWEETQLNGIKPLPRESRCLTGSRLVLIAVLLGVIALFASRVSIPPLDEAVLQALVPVSFVNHPLGAPDPPRDAGRPAATPARAAPDAAERAARRDAPRNAPF